MKKRNLLFAAFLLLTGCGEPVTIDLPDNSKYYCDKTPLKGWLVRMPDPVFKGTFAESGKNKYFIDYDKKFYGVITEKTCFIKDKKIDISYKEAFQDIKEDTPVIASFDNLSINNDVNWIRPYPDLYSHGMPEIVDMLIIGMDYEEGLEYYENNFREIFTYRMSK